MIKLFFLIIFLLTGNYLLRADEAPGGDQEFNNELDSIKNPFEDGLPKPVVKIEPAPSQGMKPVTIFKRRPAPIVLPVITLPALKVQGVIVNEDIHQAIINDQIVPLSGIIEGAQVISVTKEGVGFLFKGKKFFLKVD